MTRNVVVSCARSSLWVSLALVCVCTAAATQARPAKPGMPRAVRHESRHEIDQLEETWKDAVIHHNPQAMDTLLADDYIAISANGTLQSKEQSLQNLKAGKVEFSSIDFSDRKVRFYGQTALVTSRAEVKGVTPDGDVSGSYRFTRVYVRSSPGGWKIVSFEASRIRDPGEHPEHK